MLYMPRGTIHQAQAQQEDSVHLTISTYQRWTHAELLQRWLGAAAAASRCTPLCTCFMRNHCAVLTDQ